MTTPDVCRILFVCHANLCRSPMAESLTRSALADRLGAAAARVDVASAGTHAEPGMSMHPYAEHVLRERGAPDPGRFRSRRVTAELVDAGRPGADRRPASSAVRA